MSKEKPSFRAYTVTPSKDPNRSGYWHEVGVVWPHKAGSGFDLVLHEGIAVHGRIICVEPREKQDNAAEESAEN